MKFSFQNGYDQCILYEVIIKNTNRLIRNQNSLSYKILQHIFFSNCSEKLACRYIQYKIETNCEDMFKYDFCSILLIKTLLFNLSYLI